MCTDSLDFYRICEVPGCQWRVRQPATRCSEHGGPENVPEYWESEDGEILSTRHMNLLEADDNP